LIQRVCAAQVKLVTQPVVLALALAAMAGAGIYSLVDSIAMQRVASVGTQPLHASTFLIWVYVVLASFFWLALLMTNRSLFPLSKQFGGLWIRHPWRLLGASAMSYASYALILTAYEKGGNVAVVTSLRLWSIPLTIIMSSLLLKEDGFSRRLAASGVIVAGIMVIVWCG
jgi:drug/metabolite transporter (DMT)-like permease